MALAHARSVTGGGHYRGLHDETIERQARTGPMQA
jgi:hypothetical protein